MFVQFSFLLFVAKNIVEFVLFKIHKLKVSKAGASRHFCLQSSGVIQFFVCNSIEDKCDAFTIPHPLSFSLNLEINKELLCLLALHNSCGFIAAFITFPNGQYKSQDFNKSPTDTV